MGVGSVRKDTEMYFCSDGSETTFTQRSCNLWTVQTQARVFIYLFSIELVLHAHTSWAKGKKQSLYSAARTITRTVNKKFCPQQLPDDPEENQGVSEWGSTGQHLRPALLSFPPIALAKVGKYQLKPPKKSLEEPKITCIPPTLCCDSSHLVILSISTKAID